MIDQLYVITHEGVDYRVYPCFEFWVIEIDAVMYFLGYAHNPELLAQEFVRSLGKGLPMQPARIAGRAGPIIAVIDGTPVHAYVRLPAVPPEEQTSDRTDLERCRHEAPWGDGPIWLFASPGMGTSLGGKAADEQTLQDIEDLARPWLAARRLAVKNKPGK